MKEAQEFVLTLIRGRRTMSEQGAQGGKRTLKDAVSC